MKSIFRSIMGNQGSSLGDEPSTVISQRDLQHFDHSFKGELHRFIIYAYLRRIEFVLPLYSVYSIYSASGNLLCNTFGDNVKFAKRPINIICKSSTMDIIEEVGITNRKQVQELCSAS